MTNIQNDIQQLFPTYSKQEQNIITEYLNSYDIDDDLKIKHIKNLYKLVNIYFTDFIENSWKSI